MIECETVLRKWGNSLGVTLPNAEIQREHLKENERVHLLVIRREQTPRSTFGMFKGKITKSTQQIKDELRAELYHD